MAGVGPKPKNADERARRNKDPFGLRVIPAVPMGQPELPETFQWMPVMGAPVTYTMPEATRTWWQMWGESPLSSEFTATDWSVLLDTALLHARYWAGDHKVAAELRLRVAKFGATPEDRARLRITFAMADAIETPRQPLSVESSRSNHYEDLLAIDSISA